MTKALSVLRSLAAALLLVLAALAPAPATVSSAINKTIVLGDGTTTVFNFNFIGVAAADISVAFTDAAGNETVLTQGSGPTQYQITLNPPVTGAIWGVGGTVTYSPNGAPIPPGSSLAIVRTLPLTQAFSLQNKNSLTALGNGAETGLDTSVMQGQQIAESLSRAIMAPVVDATPPAPLPPIAQRANHGAGFDGQGNMVAVATPSTGVISSAMQPVVNAASLALGRSALGLGSLSTENIGAGLQDDGSGNVRVNSALVSVATNQPISASSAQTRYIATGPITFPLARANALWNGFAFTVYAFTGPITLTPDGADNFPGLAGGKSFIIPTGMVAHVVTDGAATGTWYVQLVPQAVTPPQGYLTPCSATVAVTGCTTGSLVPGSDVIGASALYYQTAPAGNMIPLFNGASMMMLPFPELSLTLNTNHLANTLYDVCAFNNGGVPTLVTAPAWQTTSLTGGSARGAAASIVRTQGYWTNQQAITGRNGASTFSIAANACTIVGTIFIDPTPGQVTFHRSYGQSRKWGAWNFYNRQQLYLKAGDNTATWLFLSPTPRPSNGNPNNCLFVLTGLPEEVFDLSAAEFAGGNTNDAAGIGVTAAVTLINLNGVLVGPIGEFSLNNQIALNVSLGLTTILRATYLAPPGLGIKANMALTARWRG
jgi:hypothetical protein